MITVRINDKSPTGMRIIKKLRRQSRGVTIEEPEMAPEGYLTGDEFESRCIANISGFYREKCLLQPSGG